MSDRRAQLQRFGLLMKGFIAQLEATPPTAGPLGFNQWMMQEMNKLAEALGWQPKCWDANQIRKGMRRPFWQQGVGLHIFGIGGETHFMSILMPEPSEDMVKSWGVKQGKGLLCEKLEDCWVFDEAASQKLSAFHHAHKRMILDHLLPTLRGWIVKADAEMAVESDADAMFRLGDLEESIWDALGNAKLTGEDIAKKCNGRFNSNFKQTLSSMHKRGILLNKAPGYCRAAGVTIVRPDQGQDKGQD